MKTLFGLLPLVLSAFACATERASSELVEARSAYAEASVSRAATFSPERLADAGRALERAEGGQEAAPGTPEARALAYVALRRAELARVAGDYEFDRHLVAEFRARTERAETNADAEVAPEAAPVEPPSVSSDATPGGDDELVAQRGATEHAAIAARLSGLEPLVTSREETRGMVITLDTSFIFVPKKAEILATADARLSKLASALADLGEATSVLVQGHTDSSGDDAQNLELSKRRADALRGYLVNHGVAADRVRSEGRGEAAPVASNDTAEGRALNRRMEIVVENPQGP